MMNDYLLTLEIVKCRKLIELSCSTSRVNAIFLCILLMELTKISNCLFEIEGVERSYFEYLWKIQ